MEHGLNSWIVFSSTILVLLALDLGILSKKNEEMTFKKSLLLSLFYVTIASCFGLYVFFISNAEKTAEYFTGFVLEKTMSLDNIFVIATIFKFFSIPQIYQHKVLLWGIIGVIIFRAIMIGFGAALITNFAWILYVFAIILIMTGIKICYVKDKDFNINESRIYKFLQSNFNIYNKIEDDRFFIKIDGKFYITKLFVALLIVETMDLIFAIDSIPAIFAVTKDTYIVYTSNIFAILGLRALFFCLSEIVERFKYMKYSLAIILIFIGMKILVSHFVKIPTYFSLTFTIITLASGVLVSYIKNCNNRPIA